MGVVKEVQRLPELCMGETVPASNRSRTHYMLRMRNTARAYMEQLEGLCEHVEVLEQECDEALERAAKLEKALEQEEQKSTRLQVLEGKEEVQVRAKMTLDEMRADEEQMQNEFKESQAKQEEHLKELTCRLSMRTPQTEKLG